MIDTIMGLNKIPLDILHIKETILHSKLDVKHARFQTSTIKEGGVCQAVGELVEKNVTTGT